MKSKKIVALIMAAAFVGTTCFGSVGLVNTQAKENENNTMSTLAENVPETTRAVNPYLPLWEHIPDGEPRVFTDPDNPDKQRVYIYGSHDNQNNSTYCGYDHVVWSAPVEDLGNWRYEGVSYNCGGLLYAPDVIEKGGKYYLYTYDLSHGNSVSVSDRPEGPFQNMGNNGAHKGSGIGADPAILVDDDGKMYAYWGYQTYYQAEIDPNTMAVKPGTTTANAISSCNSEGEFQFYEGTSIRKVGNKYVMVYCQKPDLDPENGVIHNNYRARLAYAYSDNPLGPWTYGGAIIDNGGELLTNGKMSYPDGNVHGGIIEANGQWYVFYHRMTNRSEFSRQAMMEPLNVSVDLAPGGKVTIEQAEMTSQGAAVDGLNAYEHYDAGIACYLTEGAYITTDYSQTSGYNPVAGLKDGCVVGYKYVNFGDGAQENQFIEMALDIKSKGTAGTIDIFIDDPNNGTRKTDGMGTKIGSIEVPANDSGDYYVEKTAVKNVTGKHALFFVFNSEESGEICEINGFEFSKKTSLFIEDFKNGMDKWDVTGTPTIKNGILTLADNTKIVSKAGKEWSNYAVELDVLEGDVSLAFRRSDADNYYTAQLSGDSVVLSVTKDGVTRRIKSADISAAAANGYKLSVSCAEEQIIVRVNGEPVLVTTDDALQNGGIGLEGTVKINSVLVTEASVTEVPRVNKIFLNGTPLNGFNESVEKYSIALEQDEEIPVVTAATNDESVRLSITQASEVPGTAVVKFIDENETKSYVIDFYRVETKVYDFTKGSMPEGWSVFYPSNPDENVTFSDAGVTITSDGTDLPGTKNQLQLDAPLEGDYQIDTHVVLDKALSQNWAKYGMTIYQNDTNMIIMDHEHDSAAKVQILWWKDGAWMENHVSQRYSGSEIYFRLDKKGNNYECLYSTDGKNYTSVYTAETDGRFEENSLLHLMVSKQNVNNGTFHATFDYVTITKLGQKADVPDDDNALEELSMNIGFSMTVPAGEYADSNAVAAKAEQMLNARDDVKALGALAKVEAKDSSYILSLSKEGKTCVTNPFRITIEEKEDPVVPGDQVSKKTLNYFLESAKAHAASGDTDDVHPDVKELFAAAIAEGEAVMGNPDATRDEVMNATIKLMLAIHALDMKFPNVDKINLEMAVEVASEIQLDKYVDAGKAEFTAALENAQSVLDNEDAAQEEVDQAWNDLLEAMNVLRFKADKNILEELLKQMEGLDLSRYTDESVKEFRAVLARAQAVIADDTLSEEDQQIVDDAVKALADAKAELTSKDDPNKPDNSKKDDGKSPSGSPKTGDTASLTLWMTVVLMMAGLAAVLKIRSKHQA